MKQNRTERKNSLTREYTIHKRIHNELNEFLFMRSALTIFVSFACAINFIVEKKKEATTNTKTENCMGAFFVNNSQQQQRRRDENKAKAHAELIFLIFYMFQAHAQRKFVNKNNKIYCFDAMKSSSLWRAPV